MKSYPEQLNFLNSANQPILKTQVNEFKKIIVLTGATSGIGYTTALELASLHAHLILVARNSDKAHKVALECLNAGASQVDIVIANLSNLKEVRTCAQSILNLTSKIDVLIHNAGMHSTKRHITSEGHEEVFALNHLASFLLTHLLIQPLLSSEQGHVLFVNSEGHRFNGLNLNDLTWSKRLYTGLRSYGASKTAQLLSMIELNNRLAHTNVIVNAMHPGDVKTNIGQNNGLVYRLFSKWFIMPNLKDPHTSSQAIAAIITTPSLSRVRNAFYHYTTLETVAAHARDVNKASEVYLKSCELCEIEPLNI
jgi:NAD(P)-dependent dehydrogenase (short-subunit alcohol dehydrogenase family)